MITFQVNGDPVAQPRLTQKRYQRKRYVPRIKRNGRWVDHPIVAWKEFILVEAMKHRPDGPLTGPLDVELTFLFRRPKAHYIKDGMHLGTMGLRQAAPIWYALKRRNDPDNLEKPVLDMMTKARIWDDDGRVASLLTIKQWDTVPGVKVSISELSP